jgi:hypothetical protein
VKVSSVAAFLVGLLLVCSATFAGEEFCRSDVSWLMVFSVTSGLTLLAAGCFYVGMREWKR